MADKKPTKEEIARRKKKTQAVKKLGECISGLRQKVSKDINSDDEKKALTALVVAIMDKTAERVGNDASAEEGHVGITGLKKKHITVSGNKVKLKYTGKSGVDHEKEFTDQRIAKMLKKYLKKAGNGYVFTTEDGLKIKAAQVNRYLKDYGVTAKDIRGYSANDMIIKKLSGRNIPKEEKDRKKVMSEVLQAVADAVGHGKATLRTHYIMPNLEDDYVKKGKINKIKKASAERVAQNFYISLIAKAVANAEFERQATKMMHELRPHVEKAYKEVFGKKDSLPVELKVEVAKMPDGKIGRYKFDEGLLSVDPKAFDDDGMVRMVLLHELAHAALGKEGDSIGHGSEFREFATALGIPEKYQD